MSNTEWTWFPKVHAKSWVTAWNVDSFAYWSLQSGVIWWLTDKGIWVHTDAITWIGHNWETDGQAECWAHKCVFFSGFTRVFILQLAPLEKLYIHERLCFIWSPCSFHKPSNGHAIKLSMWQFSKYKCSQIIARTDNVGSINFMSAKRVCA